MCPLLLACVVRLEVDFRSLWCVSLCFLFVCFFCCGYRCYASALVSCCYPLSMGVCMDGGVSLLAQRVLACVTLTERNYRNIPAAHIHAISRLLYLHRTEVWNDICLRSEDRVDGSRQQSL